LPYDETINEPRYSIKDSGNKCFDLQARLSERDLELAVSRERLAVTESGCKELERRLEKVRTIADAGYPQKAAALERESRTY
jgi:hypothetical protein